VKPKTAKKDLIYGPVPSRRLGRSLGVDLVPYKVCSYDCIYCQLGKTTEKRIGRRPYVSVDTVLEQFHRRLKDGLYADYVTLGGSGEPTLNADIGEIISALKGRSDIPVAVLTNSSLLWESDVRDALLQADVVLPSLDAYDARTFERINRPHEDIAFETMLEGLIRFCQSYGGRIWLEIFALKGVNADPAGAERFRELVSQISPDKVHVNTAVRPTCEPDVRRPEDEDLVRFCRALGDQAEVIVPFQGDRRNEERFVTEKDLLNLLARRPCTLRDIALSLNVDEERLLTYIEPLVSNRTIESAVNGTTVYYRISERNDEPYTEKEEVHSQ